MVAGDWSPDGKSVLVFAIGPQGLYQLYRIAVDTRKVTRLIEDPAHDVYPTFSRDGKSIYFTSARQGLLQLYKMPASGGPAALVAARGVIQARESADGHWLYFAEWTQDRLYRMPLAGGEITQVMDSLTDPAGFELAGKASITGPASAPLPSCITWIWSPGNPISSCSRRYLLFRT